MLGTAVFAITGVLAVTRRGLDVFGALVLGIVTALGGGTMRDLIIGAQPVWIHDFNYVWVASAGTLLAFWVGSVFRNAYRGLLYLDALGAALFGIAAADKVLSMQLSGADDGAVGSLRRGGRLPVHLRAARAGDLPASGNARVADASRPNLITSGRMTGTELADPDKPSLENGWVRGVRS